MKVLVTAAAGGLWGLLMMGTYDDPPMLNAVVGAILVGFVISYFMDRLD